MIKDERQLRTTNNAGLVGYRAKPWQCLGIIRPEELSQMVSSGPCINLDNLYNQ